MREPLPLMIAVLLLLLAARVFGELAERRQQPAMLGEILAGILLGPSLLGWVEVSPELRGMSELGVFLLVVLAGMELDPAEMKQSVQGRNGWIAVCSFLVPFVLGLGTGALFRLDVMRSVFLGLCIAITALPVSVRTLIDLGMLQTPIGQRIVSAAVFNDVVSLLALGVIINMSGVEASPAGLGLAILWTAAKAAAFALAVIAAYRGLQALTRQAPRFHVGLNRTLQRLRGRESVFATTILFVLAFASLSEAAGLHFVVGAFFGAVLLSHEILGETNFREVQKTASGVTMGFLAPIFFGLLGLEFDLFALRDVGLVATVLAVAFAGKILGGYVGGRLAGIDRRESLALGYGLNGRGIMELVIANIAYSSGFIGERLFSIIVLVGVVTTFATPLLLRRALPRPAPADGPAQ